MSPALAPVVLDLVGQLPGPDFDLLRGDALRLVGHEAAAERAFAAAADALREHPTLQGAPSDRTTLVLIKPDGVQRLLAGRSRRDEKRGLKIVGLKLCSP